MKNISLKAKVFMLLLFITGMVVMVMSFMMQRGVNEGFDKYKKSLEKADNFQEILVLIIPTT